MHNSHHSYKRRRRNNSDKSHTSDFSYKNGTNGSFNGGYRHNGKSGHSNGQNGNRRNNGKNNDNLGTPLPDTPNARRRQQRRAEENAYGDGLYNGLEVEGQTGQQQQHYYHHDMQQQQQGYPQRQNGRNGQAQVNMQEQYLIRGNGSGHGNYYGGGGQSMQHTAVIHDGVDGEREFMKKYQMCEVLGVGSTSICHRCIHKTTSQTYACKIIDKQQIEQRFAGMLSQFHSEIDALRQLSHPNIIKLYDVFTTNKKIYIVMELMAGGELFDYVVQKGTLTEAEASVIVRMVTSALVYIHECDVIHRDLKPENLLLKYKPNSIYDLEVKIIDFGLSKTMKQEHLAQTFLGTRGYLAPEMLQRRHYSRAVDTWALGVIVFVLLCGCLPFDDDSSTIFSDDVIQAKFKLRFPRWARNLSPSAKDLLSKLLDVNSSTRYTAEQALRHPWICGTTAPKDSMLHSPGKIMLTPGKKANPKNVAAANRTQMNEIIKNRARANSLTRSRVRDSSNPRPARQLTRKKSI